MSGRSPDDTEPVDVVPPLAIVGTPPPMSEGGTKGPAATRVDLGISELGIGWVEAPVALTAVEPVTVLSAKSLLPIDVQPESAAAPASRPASATAFSALLDTRLLISPLVRRYSMDMSLGG